MLVKSGLTLKSRDKGRTKDQEILPPPLALVIADFRTTLLLSPVIKFLFWPFLRWNFSIHLDWKVVTGWIRAVVAEISLPASSVAKGTSIVSALLLASCLLVLFHGVANFVNL